MEVGDNCIDEEASLRPPVDPVRGLPRGIRLREEMRRIHRSWRRVLPRIRRIDVDN